jgi:hypothetical protein
LSSSSQQRNFEPAIPYKHKERKGKSRLPYAIIAINLGFYFTLYALRSTLYALALLLPSTKPFTFGCIRPHLLPIY